MYVTLKCTSCIKISFIIIIIIISQLRNSQVDYGTVILRQIYTRMKNKLEIFQFLRQTLIDQGPRYDFENGGGAIFERLLGLLSP